MKHDVKSRKPEYWLVLCAIALVSVFFYGIRAAAVLGLAAVTAVLTDFVCLFLRGKSYQTADLSNIGTALILALMMPATIPYSIVILSTVFAVAVGTHVFGSRGDVLFPPAAVGYLFALIGWKNEVLRFPAAGQSLALFGNEAVTLHDSLSASYNMEYVLHGESLDLLIGAVYSPMGTGCLLLLLVALAVLVCRRELSFGACLGFTASIVYMAVLYGHAAADAFAVNMLLFAMVFMLGELSRIPGYMLSRFIGGLLAGLLTGYLIYTCQLEYAPVIAIVLTSPVWRALAAFEETYFPEISLRRKKSAPASGMDEVIEEISVLADGPAEESSAKPELEAVG